MTDRVKRFLQYCNEKEYKKLRVDNAVDVANEIDENVSFGRKGVQFFSSRVKREKALLFTGDDLFGFNRYQGKLPFCEPFSKIIRMCNITIDYQGALSKGISGIADEARALYDNASESAKDLYDSVFIVEKECYEIVEKYRQEAKKQGATKLYNALSQVPMKGARNYYEALVTIKFLQYILRLNQTKHVTLGRFDQYAKPYFDASIKEGVSLEELLELTQLFFISLNFDTDLYDGIQQGDNGQSMVLGGCDENGNDAFNELSEICLSASESLMIIDPKINLRVNKNTPISLYERGTKLTKQGLGFPQYSNDDIVIDGLKALGYDEKDARDYSVAACWEFIVPRYGADVPNIGTMNFPLVIERATKRITECETFDEFKIVVEEELRLECERIINRYNSRSEYYDPLVSMFLLPCIETGRDVGEYGAKYNNYGVHGAGISTATDALSAIKITVFENKSIEKKRLLDALDANFVGYKEVQKMLLDCPKMGNNESATDELADFLMDIFSKYINNVPNNRGGVYRAGSGSAMEYILSAVKVGATADGREAKSPYGSSFSPSLTTKLNGPLSAIQSFTRHDMKKVCNGGPFTIEMHDTVFRNEEGEKKVAQLIKTYIDLGGHQIQINAINRDKLLDAQKHPEKYPGLIVRVWGWSGYFNELDVEYQNHVIARTEFTV